MSQEKLPEQNEDLAWFVQDELEKSKSGRTPYGSFEIAGGRMSAYMNTASDPAEWIIEFVKDGERAWEDRILLQRDPTFGPDAADELLLGQRIEELIKEYGLEPAE